MTAYDDAYPYHFSLAEYDKKDRFDAWRAEHRHHDISWQMREVEIQDASFLGVHLGELMLGRWRFIADRIDTMNRLAHRTSRKIRQDNLDYYYLRLSLSDAWMYRVGDKQVDVKPGQLALVDLAQPYELSIAMGEVIMLMVPREYLPISTVGLHGTVLNHALGYLLADYLTLLFHRMRFLPVNEIPSVAAAVLDFINATLSAVPDNAIQARRQIDATLLNKVRWYIDQHIDRSDLNVNSICLQMGLSRSRLYRIFDPAGGVAHYIQERRLSKILAALQARIKPRPMISDLAFLYGFSSPVQLTRAFKRRFGYTPSEASERTTAVEDTIAQKDRDRSAKSWLLQPWSRVAPKTPDKAV